MAEYHVGCGIAGIYAGTLKPKKRDEWLNKSDVTKEAIEAVLGYMYFKIPEGEAAFAYGFKMRDGNYARLKVEVSDHCPEWAKEAMGEREEECVNADSMKSPSKS